MELWRVLYCQSFGRPGLNTSDTSANSCYKQPSSLSQDLKSQLCKQLGATSEAAGWRTAWLVPTRARSNANTTAATTIPSRVASAGAVPVIFNVFDVDDLGKVRLMCLNNKFDGATIATPNHGQERRRCYSMTAPISPPSVVLYPFPAVRRSSSRETATRPKAGANRQPGRRAKRRRHDSLGPIGCGSTGLRCRRSVGLD